MSYANKIINDPVFGFIKIPRGLLYDLVCHPVVQRLTRIRQLGLSSVVYPGAQHTRFQHSVGAFHLMSEAIRELTAKGNFIFDSEAEAVQAAILLHDVGHGPFSHVLEDTLVRGIAHEEISLMLMERINREVNGQLTLAIRIFQDQYPKRFLHQLVSGQLDMDRLDYLRRDSFYTGVSEGNIGSARIIKMLDVRDDRLVVESKGIYSIENFLTARRLMAPAGQHPAARQGTDPARRRVVCTARPTLLPAQRRGRHALPQRPRMPGKLPPAGRQRRVDGTESVDAAS